MYNQAALLATEIGKCTNKPVVFDVLRKIKWIKPQTLLSRSSRLTNVAGSIAVSKASSIVGRNIILVDDVMTTGSTVSVCMKLIKKAGAKMVIVLCIAAT
jgi:competence protein ComFC